MIWFWFWQVVSSFSKQKNCVCNGRDGHSVLVHGSEGTDCTLLISTLAQLIMDPGCRTLEGFLTLLEREWVQVCMLLCVCVCVGGGGINGLKV